jgi:polyisoprenoid-binding protein YceI
MSVRAERWKGLGKAGRVLGLMLAMVMAVGVPGASEDAEGDGSAPGSIQFVGRNLFATANGVFHSWQFTRVEIDREHPKRSVVEFAIEIASLDTGSRRRDEDLRSSDFFEVEKFPEARVVARDARLRGESERGRPLYDVQLDIRIRDVEKSLPATFELVSEDPPHVKGELMLNRMDFGVGKGHSRWNPTSVREEIPIRFSATLPLD